MMDESSNLSSFDLYSDLITDNIKHQEYSYNELKKKYEESVRLAEQLQGELDGLTTRESTAHTENINLKKNISALYKTAKLELTRKDQEIIRLRNCLENRWRRQQRSHVPKLSLHTRSYREGLSWSNGLDNFQEDDTWDSVIGPSSEHTSGLGFSRYGLGKHRHTELVDTKPSGRNNREEDSESRKTVHAAASGSNYEKRRTIHVTTPDKSVLNPPNKVDDFVAQVRDELKYGKDYRRDDMRRRVSTSTPQVGSRRADKPDRKTDKNFIDVSRGRLEGRLVKHKSGMPDPVASHNEIYSDKHKLANKPSSSATSATKKHNAESETTTRKNCERTEPPAKSRVIKVYNESHKHLNKAFKAEVAKSSSSVTAQTKKRRRTGTDGVESTPKRSSKRPSPRIRSPPKSAVIPVKKQAPLSDLKKYFQKSTSTRGDHSRSKTELEPVVTNEDHEGLSNKLNAVANMTSDEDIHTAIGKPTEKTDLEISPVVKECFIPSTSAAVNEGANSLTKTLKDRIRDISSVLDQSEEAVERTQANKASNASVPHEVTGEAVPKKILLISNCKQVSSRLESAAVTDSDSDNSWIIDTDKSVSSCDEFSLNSCSVAPVISRRCSSGCTVTSTTLWESNNGVTTWIQSPELVAGVTKFRLKPVQYEMSISSVESGGRPVCSETSLLSTRSSSCDHIEIGQQTTVSKTIDGQLCSEEIISAVDSYVTDDKSSSTCKTENEQSLIGKSAHEKNLLVKSSEKDNSTSKNNNKGKASSTAGSSEQPLQTERKKLSNKESDLHEKSARPKSCERHNYLGSKGRSHEKDKTSSSTVRNETGRSSGTKPVPRKTEKPRIKKLSSEKRKMPKKEMEKNRSSKPIASKNEKPSCRTSSSCSHKTTNMEKEAVTLPFYRDMNIKKTTITSRLSTKREDSKRTSGDQRRSRISQTDSYKSTRRHTAPNSSCVSKHPSKPSAITESLNTDAGESLLSIPDDVYIFLGEESNQLSAEGKPMDGVGSTFALEISDKSANIVDSMKNCVHLDKFATESNKPNLFDSHMLKTKVDYSLKLCADKPIENVYFCSEKLYSDAFTPMEDEIGKSPGSEEETWDLTACEFECDMKDSCIDLFSSEDKCDEKTSNVETEDPVKVARAASIEVCSLETLKSENNLFNETEAVSVKHAKTGPVGVVDENSLVHDKSVPIEQVSSIEDGECELTTSSMDNEDTCKEVSGLYPVFIRQQSFLDLGTTAETRIDGESCKQGAVTKENNLTVNCAQLGITKQRANGCLDQFASASCEDMKQNPSGEHNDDCQTLVNPENEEVEAEEGEITGDSGELDSEPEDTKSESEYKTGDVNTSNDDDPGQLQSNDLRKKLRLTSDNLKLHSKEKCNDSNTRNHSSSIKMDAVENRSERRPSSDRENNVDGHSSPQSDSSSHGDSDLDHKSLRERDRNVGSLSDKRAPLTENEQKARCISPVFGPSSTKNDRNCRDTRKPPRSRSSSQRHSRHSPPRSRERNDVKQCSSCRHSPPRAHRLPFDMIERRECGRSSSSNHSSHCHHRDDRSLGRGSRSPHRCCHHDHGREVNSRRSLSSNYSSHSHERTPGKRRSREQSRSHSPGVLSHSPSVRSREHHGNERDNCRTDCSRDKGPSNDHGRRDKTHGRSRVGSSRDRNSLCSNYSTDLAERKRKRSSPERSYSRDDRSVKSGGHSDEKRKRQH